MKPVESRRDGREKSMQVYWLHFLDRWDWWQSDKTTDSTLTSQRFDPDWILTHHNCCIMTACWLPRCFTASILHSQNTHILEVQPTLQMNKNNEQEGSLADKTSVTSCCFTAQNHHQVITSQPRLTDGQMNWKCCYSIRPSNPLVYSKSQYWSCSPFLALSSFLPAKENMQQEPVVSHTYGAKH